MDNSPFLPALILIALASAWYALAVALPPLIQRSRSPSAERLAEFPYVLRGPLTRLLLVIGLLFAVSPAFVLLVEALPRIPRVIFEYAEEVFLFLLRVLTGVALWFCLYRPLELIRKEFIERSLRKAGQGRIRNAALVGYYLFLPVVLLGILFIEGTLFQLNIVAAAAAAGGITVAVAFSLQTILANVFAGLTLTLDTPFSAGDLIRVGSDKLYEVRKRGIRITTVRDIETHEIVYLPNNSLITQPIVDVTQPTDDLRAVIRVSVPYGCDLREVRSILSEITHGHPHVIGSLEDKRKAIATKVYRLFLRRAFSDCKEHFIELARLEAEADLNARVRDLRARLENWAQFIDKHESQGFDVKEKAWLAAIASELDDRINDIRKATTQWMILFRNCVAKGKKIVFQNDAKKRSYTVWSPRPESIEKIVVPVLAKTGLWDVGDGSKLKAQRDKIAKSTEAWNRSADSDGQVAENAEQSLYSLWNEFSEDDRLISVRQKWNEGNAEANPEPHKVEERLTWLSDVLAKLIRRDAAMAGWDIADDSRLHSHVAPALLRSYEGLPGGKIDAPAGELQTKSEKSAYDLKELPAQRVDGRYFWLGQSTDEANMAEADVKVAAEKRPLPTGWRSLPSPYLQAVAAVHTLLAAANRFSELANVAPETKALKEQYLDAQGAGRKISLAYESLGNVYILLLRDAARWIAEEEKPLSADLFEAQLTEVFNLTGDDLTKARETRATSGVSIALCKTRTEDLYISSQASNHFIDHPLLEALAGQIDDDEERSDLAEVFRLWGDKVETLLTRQKYIVAKLKEAKSTTIDSDLRELSAWLKSEFKEPFPSWKYPLAPVEAFEDSGITVSLKFYIDNVRMDRYLRSFNAFTQIRLRIHERFNNAGIVIPYPHRDINVPDVVKVQVKRWEPPQPSQDGPTKAANLK
jgi:small-conductance mechanosensitive channel